MKKKKWLWAALAALSTTCLCYGCVNAGNDSESGETPSVEVETGLSLNTTELAMIIGEETLLVPNYNPMEGLKKTFSSSVEAVASVDEYGRITAHTVGETIITVGYGEDTATCKVTVGYGGILPLLTFEEVNSESLKVGLGELLNMGAYVTFNGKVYEDAEISYTISNPTVGAIEDGTFTSQALGETTVTVAASWRGMENISTLTKTFTVTVINLVEIVINDGLTDFTMYNIAELGGNEYQTNVDFVVHARENGVDVDAERISVEIISGTDVVEYTGDKLNALKAGEASVAVTVEDSVGREIVEVIDVQVKKSIGNYTEEVLFSAYDGELPVQELFGEEVDLVSAEVINGESLAINENKNGVLGLSASADGPTTKEIIVYSQEQGWTVKLKVYSGVIDEASDLDMFYLGNDREATGTFIAGVDTFDGYYVLANDIDCSGYVFGATKEGAGETPCNLTNPGGTGTKSMLSVGLTGIFDGQGYSITNFTPNGAGLFAAVNGGTIKNVSITGTGAYAGNGAYLSEIIRGGTLENVYVNAGIIRGYGTLGVSKFIMDSTLKNCVFESVQSSSDPAWGNVIFGVENNTFTDCYVINNFTMSGTLPTVYEASNLKPTNDTSETIWIDGLKRYESSEKMIADEANNDFSSFTSTYWGTDLGMPVWRGNIQFIVKDGQGNTLNDTCYLEQNNEISFKVFAFESEYTIPTVSIETGEDIVEVNGATIIGVSVGTAMVKLTWTLEEETYEKIIEVNVTLGVEEYDTTLLYSAKDGLFFNNSGNVVTVTDIFGADVVLSKAIHPTDALTVEDGKVFGVTTNGDAAVETYVVLYTENRVLKVNVNAYTLVIDEASDLEMFHLGGKAYNAVFTEEDVFDGYYILVKNIDMTGSVFNTAVNITDPTSIGTKNLMNMGLTGTFDGNGYSITNLSPVGNSVGLFAAINGGTLKNVSIRNAEQQLATAAPYLSAVIRNATLENVHIYTGSSMQWGGTYALSKFVMNSTFKNCVFENLNGNDRHTLFFQIWDEDGETETTFTNCYNLCRYSLSSSDAWYDNGLPLVDASNKKPEGDTSETVWVDGIKRYADKTEFINDAANNDYSSFTKYWDTTSGMPVWIMKA